MNVPALLAPPAVVTTTETLPAVAPAGTVTASWVGLSTVGVALAPPNDTAVAVLKLVPVMISAVPPASGPSLGVSVAMLGAATYW